MATSLEKFGGPAAINFAVKVFYEELLKDEEIAHFFDDAELHMLKNKVKSFLQYALGGHKEYRGRDMKTAHSGIMEKGLDKRHFDLMVKHLDNTLINLGIEQELRDEIIQIFRKAEKQILNN